MSKAIYRPKGKALEYAPWACNLYVGCPNGCTYCFNRKGALGTVAGGGEAVLKKCFRDEDDAFSTFTKELSRYGEQIKHDGSLLFSFTTDPCLPETRNLTFRCIAKALEEDVPCQVLTKRADWVLNFAYRDLLPARWRRLSVGFTLTGCDYLERNASPNMDRIQAMRILHKEGLKTFASIEPVIDFEKSLEMIKQSLPFCDHYKIGLLTGDPSAFDRYRMPYDLWAFHAEADALLRENGKTVYWKKSITEHL